MLLRFTSIESLGISFWGFIFVSFPDGIHIVYLEQAPTFTIVSNAGFDGPLVLGKLLEQDDPKLGYDAAKGWFFIFYVVFLYFNTNILANFMTFISCS